MRGREGLQDEGERTKQSREDFPTQKPQEEDSLDKEEAEFLEQLESWRKKGGRGTAGKGRKKFKAGYATADDLAASSTFSDNLPKQRFIDMTGPQVREVASADQLGQGPKQRVFTGADGSVPVPELQHNLSALVEMATSDVMARGSQLRREKDRQHALRQELGTLDRRVQEEAKHIARLQRIIVLVDEQVTAAAARPLLHRPLTLPCRGQAQRVARGAATLETCRQTLQQLQGEFGKEYEVYELGSFALALVLPLMKARLADWDPLRAPLEHLGDFEAWRQLMTHATRAAGLDGDDGDENMSDYDRLCWETVLPALRAGLRTWDVMTPEPVIEFLEAWHAVLPAWITGYITEQLLVPQLLQHTRDWRPSQRAPPHVWLHPWLPVLGPAALKPLFPDVRNALHRYLLDWHPSQTEAVQMLVPWREPFGAKVFDNFVAKTVVPKLALLLKQFTVDPARQVIEPFQWTMAWAGVLSRAQLAELLEQHFFPKLLGALCQWLDAGPDYGELLAWYQGWAGLFPSELRALPTVDLQFHIALRLMARALADPDSKTDLALATEATLKILNIQSASAARADADAAAAAAAANRFIPASAAALGNELNMRDVVERLAQQIGVLFAPKPGRTTGDGKQLYAFGARTIYIDNNVVFAKDRADASRFVPVGLDELSSATS